MTTIQKIDEDDEEAGDGIEEEKEDDDEDEEYQERARKKNKSIKEDENEVDVIEEEEEEDDVDDADDDEEEGRVEKKKAMKKDDSKDGGIEKMKEEDEDRHGKKKKKGIVKGGEGEELSRASWKRERRKTHEYYRSHSRKQVQVKKTTAEPQRLERWSSVDKITDCDFDEVEGCIDLGLISDSNQMVHYCGVLPALWVCHAINQSAAAYSTCSSPSTSGESPIFPPSTSIRTSLSCPPSPLPTLASSWRLSSPGDDDKKVKARLLQWAKAVKFNVRLSSTMH